LRIDLFVHHLARYLFNVVGFSLDGMIAQQLALDHPDRVKRIVLLGTGPRGGEGMTFMELSSEERADPDRFLLTAFFSPTDASQTAGRAYLNRLAARTRDRDRPVSPRTAEAQLRTIREWGAVPSSNRYATLQNIKHPTLVVHGTKIRYREDFVDGVEKAPEAFIGMLEGRNFGKLIVRVDGGSKP
jgi:pimeloyl-ACP methyl ester carboxylesterase